METKKYGLAMEVLKKEAKRVEKDEESVKSLLREKAHVIKLGLADCHGIESYFGKEKAMGQKLALFDIRARENRQRHSVIYKVEITTGTNKKVQDAMKLKKYILALSILKKEAIKTWFPSEQMQRSWELIPNPKLDPWR